MSRRCIVRPLVSRWRPYNPTSFLSSMSKSVAYFVQQPTIDVAELNESAPRAFANHRAHGRGQPTDQFYTKLLLRTYTRHCCRTRAPSPKTYRRNHWRDWCIPSFVVTKPGECINADRPEVHRSVRLGSPTNIPATTVQSFTICHLRSFPRERWLSCYPH